MGGLNRPRENAGCVRVEGTEYVTAYNTPYRRTELSVFCDELVSF